MKEIGVSGTKITGGVFYEDYNVKMLSSAYRWDEFARIHNDSHVTQVRNALMLPVLQADFYLEHDEEDPMAVEIAEFVHSQLHERDNQSWTDIIRVCLKYIFDGVSIIEKVYENIEWNGKKYTGIKKLSYRHPRTIRRWIIKDGELQSIEQQAPRPDDGNYVTNILPADKIIILTHNQIGDNYEGEPFYRVIWKNWKMKEAAEKSMSMYLERVASGIVDVEHAGNLSKQEADDLEELAKNYRGSEYGYFIHKNDVKINIHAVQGGATETLVNAINYHVEAISKGMLVQFLNLGSTQTGSRAVSSDHSDFFMLAVQSIADNLADKLTDMLIMQLCAYNWDAAQYKGLFPNLKARSIKSENVKEIAETYRILSDMGAISMSRQSDITHVRKQLSMPDLTADELAEIEQNKEDMKNIRKAPVGAPVEDDDKRDDDNDNDDKVNTASEKPSESPKSVVDMREYFDGLSGDKERNVLTGIYGEFTDDEYMDARRYAEARLSAIDTKNTNIQKRVKSKAMNVITDFQKKVLDKILKNESPRGSKASNYQSTLKSMRNDYIEAYENGVSDYTTDIDRHKEFSEPQTFANAWVVNFMDEAETAMSISLRRIEDSGERAMHEATRLKLKAEQRISYLTAAVMELSDDVLTRAVKSLVNIAYGEGRMEAVAKFKPKLQVYSAAFDRATCIECSYRDGQLFEAGDPRYQVNPTQTHCLGGSSCRCITIPYEV